LISPESASAGLNRQLILTDLRPATLKGFTRCWNAVEKIRFHGHAAASNGIFLNLRPSADAEVNGVLLALNKQELEQMKLREKNYDCIDVSGQIIKNTSDCVYTFITPPDRTAHPGLQRACVPAGYLKLICDALRLYDDQFVAAFKKSTDPLNFEVCEGEYSFVDAQQERYAGGKP
jgi:hypothetical protein